MAIKLTLRKGSTAEHTTYTGDQGEVTVEHPVDGNGDAEVGNTTTYPWRLRVHDGSVAGGHIIATRDGTDTFTNKTYSSGVLVGSFTDTNSNTVATLPGNGSITIPTVNVTDVNNTTVNMYEELRRRSLKMAIAIGGGDF